MTAKLPFTLALTVALLNNIPASASRVGSAVDARIRPAEGFADIVDKTLPSVVRVVVKRAPSASVPRRASGEASGVLIAADGYILTNHHVIEGATSVRIQLHDEREFAARLIAADPQTDLAVLKIDSQNLPYLEFGDSSTLRVGDLVLAIGNPFGIGVTVTSGIVSARSRSTGVSQYEDFIQTDAAINPGNSGGPLVNRDGDLIGINTAIVSPSGGSNGIGFAIPANLARSAMSELIVNGKVRRGYLGVGLQPMNAALAEALGIEETGGALIADVAPGSPAATAGLEKGSVVTAIDNRAVRSFDRLRLYIAEAKPGVTIRLRVSDLQGEKTIPVTLTERLETTSVASEEQLPGGAVVSDAALASGSPGVLMLAVDPDGEFAEAGLRPGDVIAFVNRKPVTTVTDLKREIAATPAKSVLLEVSRRGSSYFFAMPRSDH